jgi:S-(hydroxymethyl)glutathione dehydrogenase/alcohol dehydrogenase
MRAAVLHECPGWLDITDLEVGSIGPHEVLVHTNAAGLCHSDLHCIEGTLPIGVPSVPGSGCGRGRRFDVAGFRPGDGVMRARRRRAGVRLHSDVRSVPGDHPRRRRGPAARTACRSVRIRGRRRFRRADTPPERALLKIDERVPVEVAVGWLRGHHRTRRSTPPGSARRSRLGCGIGERRARCGVRVPPA